MSRRILAGSYLERHPWPIVLGAIAFVHFAVVSCGSATSDAGARTATADASTAADASTDAHPSCPSDQPASLRWIRENPAPGDFDGIPIAVTASSAKDFYVVGCGGVIGHSTDGVHLRSEQSCTSSDLESVWRSPGGDVFAAGYGVLLHSKGDGVWHNEPTDTNGNFSITSLWGSSVDNVYAVGVEGIILHRHGGLPWKREDSGSQIGLTAVWGNGPNDVYAAKLTGQVLHSAGDGHWSALSTPASGSVNALWGSKLNDIIAAGNQVWRSSNGGASWNVFDPGYQISSLTGRGPSDLFAMTARGDILRGDGATWHVERPGNGTSGGNVAAAPDGTVYAVGPNASWCVSGDAHVWSTSGNGKWVSRYSGEDIYGISAADPSHVYAVGSDGTVLVSDGSGHWVAQDCGVKEPLFGVWASPTRVWVVGDHGTILRSSGDGHWVAETSGTDALLRDVWASSDGEVFAVGGDGVLLHRRKDGTWASESNAGWELRLYGVWGSGPDDVYAVGDRGLILHRTASGWHSEDSGVLSMSASLNAISGRSAGDIYAVGDNGLVLHSSGDGVWHPSHVGSTSLQAVWAGPKQVVAVGRSSAIVLGSTSTGWSVEQTAATGNLYAVSGAGDAVWAAGEVANITRRVP